MCSRRSPNAAPPCRPPFLNWAGAAERQQIRVPTIPLFVHERHSTQAILKTMEGYKAAGTQLDLFGDPQLDVADQLDAYEHLGPWSNRLMLGDSLQVMIGSGTVAPAHRTIASSFRSHGNPRLRV